MHECKGVMQMSAKERIRIARLAEHMSLQPEYARRIGITLEHGNDHEYADRSNGKEVKYHE